MRYREIIFEALDQTIVINAEKEIKKAISDFSKTYINEYIKLLGAKDLIDSIDDLGDISLWRKLPYDQQDALYEKRGQLISRVFDKSIYALDQEQVEDYKSTIMPLFIETLEHTFQQVAKKAVEQKYGKIDPIPSGTPYDERKDKYLNFLQHIIVHIDLEGFTSQGEKQDSGGHFQKIPNQQKYNTAYARNNVDWFNDLGVAIKLFTNEELVWQVIREKFAQTLEFKLTGDNDKYDKTEDKFLKSLLSTFVHECVHLFQHIEQQHDRSKKPRMIGPGITYTPTNGKRGKKQRNVDKRWVYLRGGKRKADYLGGKEELTSDRYESYFGAPHEIEAHAAGQAAKMIYEFIQERKTYREEVSQSDINQFVNDKIDDLKNGYFGFHHNDGSSLSSYIGFIRDKIADVDQTIFKADGSLVKVDTLHRKVWRKFLLKLVLALKAYVKKD